MKSAVAFACLLLAGCSLLAPQPNRLRHFVIDGSSAAGPPPETIRSPSLRLGVGPLSLPDYLRRSEIVRRVDEHQLRFHNQDRWAEPLELGLLRTVTQAVRQQQPEWLVVRVPGPVNLNLDAEVPIEVLRFEDDGTSVHLNARWAVRVRQEDSIVLRESLIEEPLSGNDMPAVVAAMGRAANRLAAEISATVASKTIGSVTR